MAMPVEVDPNPEETFSAYESNIPSADTSLTSSVFDYTYENGRRYHAYRAGQYLLPNDDKEQDRLDFVHHLFLLTLKGDLCVTKLENPQSILDVGTGTGIWAIEMGDMYPSAEVIGTDLSPIQPPWVPPNVKFEIDDARQAWTFPLESFDFIHARTLWGSILDWPTFIKSCFDHLQPGGKIEIVETRATFLCDDGTLPDDSYMRKWLTEMGSIGQKLGMKFDIVPEIPQMLKDATFVDVKQHDRIVPLGTWTKDLSLKKLGAFFRMQFLDMGLEAYTLALFTRNGWTEAETQVLMAHVRDEVKSNKMHVYTIASFVTAEKLKVT